MSYDDRRLSENLRLRLGTTVNIPDTNWLVDADWIWNNSRREWVSLDPAWPLTVDSLRCQGGPNGTSCWKPILHRLAVAGSCHRPRFASRSAILA